MDLRSKDDLTVRLQRLIEGQKELTTYEKILSEVIAALDLLVDQGYLSLGEDCQLTGRPLEIRVRLLFEKMGLNAVEGRAGREDFTVAPPSDDFLQIPLVIEVKSSRKPQVTRDCLRQVDDWVYDLSQEEVARKQGLGGGVDDLATLTHGLSSTRHRHPSPYKGVLIVNAPVGTPFECRTESCVASNDIEFVEKRNFCVIPIQSLAHCCDAISAGQSNVIELWNRIHGTCGVLRLPLASDRLRLE
jgi:hypothetical protein